MLDKVFSARYVYRFDEEMNEFFKTLVHVQYDLTGICIVEYFCFRNVSDSSFSR